SASRFRGNAIRLRAGGNSGYTDPRNDSLFRAGWRVFLRGNHHLVDASCGSAERRHTGSLRDSLHTQPCQLLGRGLPSRRGALPGVLFHGCDYYPVLFVFLPICTAVDSEDFSWPDMYQRLLCSRKIQSSLPLAARPFWAFSAWALSIEVFSPGIIESLRSVFLGCSGNLAMGECARTKAQGHFPCHHRFTGVR